MKFFTYLYLFILIGDILLHENEFSIREYRHIIMNTMYFIFIVLLQVLFCNYQHENEERRRFIGFCGLVGKDDDIVRGLLVDTGASINLHGADWFKSFMNNVINPNNLWSKTYSMKSNVTGIEGKSMGTNIGHTVPGGLTGYDKYGNKRFITASFDGQEVRGAVPALLGLPSMIMNRAIINCRDHTMTIDYYGEDIIFYLIYTKSGHYILPFDEIAPSGTVDYSESKIGVAMHASEVSSFSETHVDERTKKVLW